MTVSNTDDIIDSRDVIARIEELRSELEDAVETDEGWVIVEEDRREIDMNEEYDELEVLAALAEDGEASTSDWPHGVILIRDSYFETYAEEFARDIGAIGEGIWPTNCIDWEKAANDLKMDYTTVEFDGEDYWVR